MKKVLLISNRFPPHLDVGGLRAYGLFKHLSNFGWEPIVLTTTFPENAGNNSKIYECEEKDLKFFLKKKLGFNLNESVKEQLNENNNEINNNFWIDYLLKFYSEVIEYPDGQKGWYKPAIKKAEKIISEEKIDLLFSTFPPATSHLIAKKLKIKYNIPWIADMRDLWTQYSYYEHTNIRKFFEQKLEHKTLSCADVLTTVSKPFAKKLKTLHKNDIFVKCFQLFSKWF